MPWGEAATVWRMASAHQRGYEQLTGPPGLFLDFAFEVIVCHTGILRSPVRDVHGCINATAAVTIAVVSRV